ncbi:ArdC-like ssDNA-binding domain-containing protein [Helicobacter bizzozeronii]|uniref:ArdC-like ssDNA-binding domain-containing protein n=1 Tax=Helicobacter bizzozeronii TaxID=56877 RepID=UPI000CEE76A5|nr:ArdC-like ssDNA-binding domain-containing protein [Helicobacter bizzozeronii]
MKSWDEISVAEQKAMFRDFLANEINTALEQGLAFKPHNRAYNAHSGSAYSGLNALILDAKQKEGNYTSNAWISLEEAQKLGADARELEFIHSNTQSSQNPQGAIKKASISYVKTHEIQKVPKKDAQGNPIPLLDGNGNQRYNRYGEYLFEMEEVRVEIPPRLEIKHLYNVECFKSIDRTHLKPLNPKSLKPLYTDERFSLDNQSLVIYDLSAKLTEPQYQRVLDYVGHYAQHNQQYARDRQQPSQRHTGANTPKPSQSAQSNMPHYANQSNQPHHQAPSNQPQQDNTRLEMAMPQAPIALENQQGMQIVMQILQEQQKVIQILQEQQKTIQKMAQEIAWLKTQQQSKNEALNATYFATPSKGRGR